MTDPTKPEEPAITINYTTAVLAKLPAKFRDAKTGTIQLDTLITSYLELEKKLSASVPSPETPEGKAKVLSLLGVPPTPQDYNIDVSHGLFTVDPDVNNTLHSQGFTQDQAQTVYDLAATKLVPALQEVSNHMSADREVERLIAAFGGPEKWAEISRQLLAFGQKNLTPQLLSSLSSSFDGVMALYRMMKAQEPGISVRADTTNAADAQTPDDLRSMMRDPKYWRERDPSYVAKVTTGFQKIYGAQ